MQGPVVRLASHPGGSEVPEVLALMGLALLGKSLLRGACPNVAARDCHKEVRTGLSLWGLCGLRKQSSQVAVDLWATPRASIS